MSGQAALPLGGEQGPAGESASAALTLPPPAGWPAPPHSAAFCGLLGEIVHAIAPHTESDPVAILSQLLVGFGAAAGRGAHYQVEATRHHPNEFLLLVGDSARARKGSSFQHVRHLLCGADPTIAERILTGLSSGEGRVLWRSAADGDRRDDARPSRHRGQRGGLRAPGHRARGPAPPGLGTRSTETRVGNDARQSLTRCRAPESVEKPVRLSRTLRQRPGEMNTEPIKGAIMKRFRILAVGVLALLAVTAITAGAASAALPEFLPLTFPKKFAEVNLKSAKAILNVKGNGLKVECTSVEFGTGAGGEITSAKLGKIDLLFLGCKSSLGTTCTGLKDTTAGSILVEGEFHLRFHTKTPTLTALIALLLKEVHFECGFGTLVTVKAGGCVASLITPVGTASEDFLVKYEQVAAGEQKPLKIFNEAGTAEEECAMEAEVNGSAFAFGSEVAEGLIKTEAGKPVTIDA